MAIATSLAQAAGQAFDNLHIHWLANQLQQTLNSFWKATLASFPESEPDSHPVSNWLTLIAGLASTMPITHVPLDQLTQAANFVFRLCWMANELETNGGISNTQATFLLSSYNVIIGFP
jgi:hypothetical protein